MSKRKPNTRIETWNLLCEHGLSDKKEIAKLQLEQLKDIIHDPTFQNILLLRKYIKERNETEYFNVYSEENKRRKPNARIETWNLLCKHGLSDKKEINNLQLEQLKDIIHDSTFQNILLLRKYIKEGNETKYFNIYSEDNERKEEN